MADGRPTAWGLLVLGAWLAGVACGAPANAAPTTHKVTIENMRFNPERLTVQQGDRIVWVNKDFFPHTATGKAKQFDSGSIAVEGSWTYVAQKPGEYAYSCTFHPTMAGMITVQ